MADIEFKPKIEISGYSALTYSEAFKEYDNFHENEVITVDLSSGSDLKVGSLTSTAAQDSYELLNVLNLGYIAHGDVMQLTQELQPNEWAELFSMKLGEDESGMHKVFVRAYVAKSGGGGSGQTAYVFDSIKFDLEYESTLTVAENLWTQSITLYPLDPVRSSRIGIGLGFMKLPNRDDSVNNRLLCIFVGTLNSTGTDSHYTIQKYNDTSYHIPQQQSYDLQTTYFSAAVDLAELPNVNDMHFVYTEASPEAGPPSEEGGYNPGDDGFDDSSDTIDLPDTPLIGVTNVGFVNVYKTGSQSLQNMGVELFPALAYTPPVAITGSDVTDAVVNGFNAVVTFLANIPSFFEQITANTYINYIIDCHVLPVTPSGGTQESIKVGSKTLTAQGYRLSSDYVDVDCGTISLKEYYANFADFLTSFKLYLPFVGFVPARPEWFYRESLNVTYRFNVIDGSFIAFVRSTGAYVNNNNSGKTIVGQYGGNACVHLPITGVTYASMVSGLVGAGAGAIAGAATGNIPAIATSAIGAATQHGDIAQSNSYSSSVAFLGCRRPFVLIERPVSNFSKTYSKEMGIPSNISKKIGSVSGFAMLGDVHLDGITATDAEKAEIERLLHEGVIL